MRSLRRARSSELSDTTLAVVMAGGNGTRLGELTRRHSKPALSFGGQYRNIDFTLSNCVNSGIRRIALLTQYKGHSLIQHVHRGWNFLPAETGEFVEVWPAQQRDGSRWYAGTADAVFQNLDLVTEHRPRYVLVLAGDHVYKMDYQGMLETHAQSGADATVGCVEVPVGQASGFGIVATDAAGRILCFAEKPAEPEPLPENPERALASMGIYVFNYSMLAAVLELDAVNSESQHDFGRDVLPMMIRHARVASHAFRDSATGTPAYWRDVGTLDGYWEASMDLLDDEPKVDLHDEQWPVWSSNGHHPPPRFVGEGVAQRSIVAGGCTVRGRIERSVLSTGCRVAADALVERSVLLPDVEIGRGARVRNAIVDAGCVVPGGTVIGSDPVADGQRYSTTASGVVLVTGEALGRPCAGPAMVADRPAAPRQATSAARHRRRVA